MDPRKPESCQVSATQTPARRPPPPADDARQADFLMEHRRIADLIDASEKPDPTTRQHLRCIAQVQGMLLQHLPPKPEVVAARARNGEQAARLDARGDVNAVVQP